MVKVAFSKVAYSLICAGALFAAAAPGLFADSITLNSGKEIQGVIVRQTDTEVVMEVEVASGILDQKSFPKSEIKTVVKISKDQKAFEKLKNCDVRPTSYLPGGYDRMIATLQEFRSKFPSSPFAAQAQQRIDLLSKEKDRVKLKEFKWNNRWYTPQEAEPQKYQIEAQKLLVLMQDQTSRFNYVGALNTFDQLERAYPGSQAYPDAVRLAIGLIYNLNREVDRVVPLNKLQAKRFDDGIVLVAEPEKSRMIAARKAQIAAAEAALAAADRASLKWKPLLPIVEKSTDDLKKTCVDEMKRLQALPVASMRNGIAAANAAAKELAARNLPAAEARLDDAKKLWPANEMLTGLTSQAAELKKELAATPTPSPTPKKGSSKTAPKPGHHPQSGHGPAAKPAAPSPAA